MKHAQGRLGAEIIANIVEVVGDEDKVRSLIDLLSGFGVMEVMRTGTVAMNRGTGNKPVRVQKQTKSWDEASSV